MAVAVQLLCVPQVSEKFRHWTVTMRKQEQTVVVPGLHASFNSLSVRPSMLCFACPAIWHGARDVNLRDGIAIKCLNWSISSII